MISQLKQAIIIGASGLIGNQLVRMLLSDNHFLKVTIFVRNDLPISVEKFLKSFKIFGIMDKIVPTKKKYW